MYMYVSKVLIWSTTRESFAYCAYCATMLRCRKKCLTVANKMSVLQITVYSFGLVYVTKSMNEGDMLLWEK